MKIYKNDLASSVIIEEEIIVINPSKASYFGLEGAALELWKTLEKEIHEYEQILNHWRETFGNSEQEIKQLLNEAITTLLESELITIKR